MTNKLLIALFSGITLLNQPVHGQDAVKFIIQSDHPSKPWNTSVPRMHGA